MGFLERAKDFAGGLGGLVRAPVGLVFDLAKSPWAEDEYDGVLGTFFGLTSKRGGELVDDAIGPEGVTGSIIGALPEGPRSSLAGVAEGAVVGAGGGAAVGSIVPGPGTLFGAVVGLGAGAVYGAVRGPGALEDAEMVGREFVREPLAAALMAESYAEAPGGGGLAGLFRPEHWREGYRAAQDVSWGQALAINVGTDNIRDQAELNEFIGSGTYSAISTTADFVGRFFGDPTVVGGKALGAARRNAVAPLRSADDIAEAMSSSRVARFIDAAEQAESPARLRDQFFPNDAHGVAISNVIFDAPGTANKRLALQALMGDTDAYRALRETYAPGAAQVDRLMAEKLSIVQYEQNSLFGQPERLATVTKEIDELVSEQRRLDRLDDAIRHEASLREVPKSPYYSLGPVQVPSANAVRSTFNRSDFYQTSSMAAPLRTVFGKEPQPWVNLHSQTGDVQVSRLLNQSPLDDATRDAMRTRYMQAANPAARQIALEGIERRVTLAFAARAGMDVDDMRELMTRMQTGRKAAQEALKSRTYDGKGRSIVSIVDDAGVTHQHHVPLLATQEVNFFPMPDLEGMRSAAHKMAEFKSRHPSTRIPSELAQGFYDVWKPSVLIRVGWPIRVVGDEQLRIMAKIGAVAQAKTLINGGGRFIRDVVPELPAGAVDGLMRQGGPRAKYRAGKQRALLHHRGQGIGEIPSTYKGYEIQSVYGSPGDAANQYRQLNSSDTAFRNLVGMNEDDLLNSFRKDTGNFRSIDPTDPAVTATQYAAAWHRAVNQQLGLDPIARRLLRGDTVDDTVRWLESTREGQRLAARFHYPGRGKEPEKWVRTISEVIEDYTLGDAGIKAAMRNGKADISQLRALSPDITGLPMVHGEIVNQLTGGGFIKQWVTQSVEDAFVTLGRTPSDVLSRNPFMDHMYRAEMRRLIDIAEEQRLTGKPVFDRVMEVVEEATPGTPEIRVPGSPIRSAYDGAPPIFHGTSSKIDGPLTDRWSRGSGAHNLFGPGFYTTDAQDIASAYTKKGGGKAPITYNVEWKGGAAPKFLDLDTAAPDTFRQAARQLTDAEYLDIPIEVADALRALADDTTATAGELIRRARHALGEAGITRADADEIIDQFGDLAFDAGFDGYTHMGGGGRYASKPGDPEHQVRIFLEPEKLSISEVTKESITPAVPGKPAVTRERSVLRPRPEQLDEATLRGIETKARTYALAESKDLLYDLAERSRLSEILKFFVPFYSAWEEVITRWGGLALENPAFVARARLAWNAPEKAGIITDENGNIVDENGNAKVALTGEVAEPGKDRYITMSLAPDAIQDILKTVPGAQRLVNSRYNKVSFNLALSGLPGAGPTVQVPVNYFVRERPELEASVKAILPFGVNQSLLDQMLPATLKRQLTVTAGMEDREYANTVSRIYQERMVDHNLGKREEAPTWAESKAEADALYNLRTFASFVSPAAPNFISPYQPYIDAYRAGQAKLDANPMALADAQGNERTADEWFLDTYPDYFPLTQSLSRSMDGVNPTLEGFEVRKKYQDLIEEYPELGGLIVGAEGAGDFSNAVYQYQLAHGLKPGSTTKQRETPTFEFQETGPEVREGWIHYRRAMDLIDIERSQRGLPSLNVKAAEDLAYIKRAVTDKLEAEYPAWAEARQQVDLGAWKKRLAGMEAIVNSDEFAARLDRTDISGLADYLDAREMVLAELKNRGENGGPKTMDAAANMDIAYIWDQVTTRLVDEHGPAYPDLFYRWLETDPMEVE